MRLIFCIIFIVTFFFAQKYSQGGSTLGMDMNHCDLKNFTLDDHQEEKRQVHREILLRQKRYEKMYQKQQQTRTPNSNQNQSDSDDDSLDNISDISDSELEFDSWYFLQPVPVKQRRALLRDAGINKIDSSEKEECRDIRLSREFCGCDCRIYCDPETCLCSLAGIKCQVDRLNFPCGCSRGSCGNLNGRIEFNQLRVRTHFMHTIMRLELEKNNENQQFINETTSMNNNSQIVDHPYHLKTNNTQNSTNIELINQNTLFNPSTSSVQLDSPYELKFIQSSQSNDLYTTIESSNNMTTNSSNIFNEANLTNFDYNEFYDSTSPESGASYSESCSECTSEELDCRLTTAADNQTINGLTFNLISNVPTTNNELISNTTVTSYEANNGQVFSTATNNFLTDQSFRYYTVSGNNSSNTSVPIMQQLDQNSSTTNDQQLVNHLHYQTYYQDTLYNNNNLVAHQTPTATVTSNLTNNSLTSSIDYVNDLPKAMLNNGPQLSTAIDNNFTIEQHVLQQPSFETHQYTDLSQSIASKSAESQISLLNSSNVVCPVLISTNSSQLLNANEFDSIVVEQITTDDHHGTILNSSDDSSSGQSTQNEEEPEANSNFGELIKNTIVESVTA